MNRLKARSTWSLVENGMRKKLKISFVEKTSLGKTKTLTMVTPYQHKETISLFKKLFQFEIVMYLTINTIKEQIIKVWNKNIIPNENKTPMSAALFNCPVL